MHHTESLNGGSEAAEGVQVRWQRLGVETCQRLDSPPTPCQDTTPHSSIPMSGGGAVR
jgi:hypothetical protein